MNLDVRGSTLGVVAYVLDFDIVVSKIELQSHYCIHFRTNAPKEKYETSYPQAMG